MNLLRYAIDINRMDLAAHVLILATLQVLKAGDREDETKKEELQVPLQEK